MHYILSEISYYVIQSGYILIASLFSFNKNKFGSCHRNEPSGTLHGIMRVRNFVQDDGHIFCSSAQIQSEVSAFIDLTFRVYKHFGFENVDIKLSTRPEKRVGSDEVGDRAEAAFQSRYQ
jgi:threonyl-tRNA synthetase